MDQSTTVTCSLLAIDHTNFCYKVCSGCERTLPETDDQFSSICKFCNFNFSHSPPYKRLFRLLVSIATDKQVKTVVCFDRAARVLFGCSADEFFRFANLNPLAAGTAGQILEGEMIRITLTKPRNGNAQHLRVSSIVPLRSGFQPAIVTLREYYGQRAP